MEIIMDFNKPSGCKKIEKFLLDNLNEKEKESLRVILTRKTVRKADAIDLVITLVQAMTIANELISHYKKFLTYEI